MTVELKPKTEREMLIQNIKKNIDWIEKNLGDKQSGLFMALKSSKKEIIASWAEWIETLIDLGEIKDIQKHEIATHIKKIMRTKGLDDSVISYVHEVLPFKYRNQVYNPKKNEDIGEVKPHLDSSNYETENKQFLERWYRTIDVIYLFISKLKKTEYASRLSDDPEEFLRKWDNLLEKAEESLDDRKTVILSTQPHLIFCIVNYGMEKGISEYLNNVKDMSTLTAKQANKIVEGKMQTMDILLEPKTKLEAKLSGYYGVSCPQCGSWRVLNDWNTVEFQLRCYSCKKLVPNKTERLHAI